MTRIDPTITNTEVIPTLESHVFDANPESRFAVGVLAVGNRVPIGGASELLAHYELRRRVYVEQTGQLSAEELAASGGVDRDSDDERSVAFGVLENMGDHEARLVATMRLIIKGLGASSLREAMSRPLPVEREWEAQFRNHPAPATALEVSRLISRHESAGAQRINKLQLYAAALAFTEEHNLGPAYAIVEGWLERDLSRLAEHTRIGEPRYVPHYLDDNVALQLNIHGLRRRVEELAPGAVDTMPVQPGQFAYYGRLRAPAAEDGEEREIA